MKKPIHSTLWGGGGGRWLSRTSPLSPPFWDRSADLSDIRRTLSVQGKTEISTAETEGATLMFSWTGKLDSTRKNFCYISTSCRNIIPHKCNWLIKCLQDKMLSWVFMLERSRGQSRVEDSSSIRPRTLKLMPAKKAHPRAGMYNSFPPDSIACCDSWSLPRLLDLVVSLSHLYLCALRFLWYLLMSSILRIPA